MKNFLVGWSQSDCFDRRLLVVATVFCKIEVQRYIDILLFRHGSLKNEPV